MHEGFLVNDFFAEWRDAEAPVGVRFVRRFGDEATLFRRAAQIEEARPWAHKRPPVSAV